ncbi:efflux RND transporter periplasmic adaptor subunit [Snuella lapsa]|uniref:Efflux RND transporter periplasmic adaptor subunit n=1 Tax=Snuella lapsa TaxID=870481 RepID=A0ABP6YLK8_9FLAO
MKRYKYIIALTTVALLFSACGNNTSKNDVTNTVPLRVQVGHTNKTNNHPFLAVSGKVQSVNSADLSTRIMGYVDNIYVDVGDRVHKGQLLISIHMADLRAKRAQVKAGIAEAEAAFLNAEKDFNRFKNLFANNSASQKELDDVSTRYHMTKARLEAANQQQQEIKAQFEYANIKSPFNGIVTSKMVKVGNMAQPGQTLISVEAPDNFEVMASVPESEITQIKSDTQVTVVIKSINKEIVGTVTEVSASAKNTGGQYLVKVALGKTDTLVRSGMFATVNFPVKSKGLNPQVLIPQQAVINHGGLTGIYTVSQNNTAVLRWLRLGKTFGDQVEVLSGLSENETFIVSAEGKLFNGANISIQ